MSEAPEFKQDGAKIEEKPLWISIAKSFLAIITIGSLAAIVGIISNIGQICDSKTISWRFESVCNWLAKESQPPVIETKPAPEQPKPAQTQPAQPLPVISKPAQDRDERASSDERFSKIENAAEKWRSRIGPIHENLADLLGSITTYDKSRFGGKPNAKSAWDYLQSMQKIINAESFGITSKNKSDISINVNIAGTGDIGDRAAYELNEWLGENRFNTTKNDSDIYISIEGSQSSSPNPYTTYSAATTLNLNAKWLDGSTAFMIHIPPSTGSGARDDAENRSFANAVSKMIAAFQAQVQN